jgi:hypothetical protein
MTESTSKSPTHIAYHVTERNGKSYWTRIGAAWSHKDGKGFNIELNIMPLDGSISLRVASEKREPADAPAAEQPAAA